MPLLLPLVFLSVPLIEIALFVVIGGQIGLLATMALVVLTAVLGTILLRIQGFSVLMQARQALDEGRMPLKAVADGVFLLAAGLLLLTPGFFTDTIGFLLFVPRVRTVLGRTLLGLLLDRHAGPVRPKPGANTPPGRARPPTIEGEVLAKSDAAPPRRPADGPQS